MENLAAQEVIIGQLGDKVLELQNVIDDWEQSDEIRKEIAKLQIKLAEVSSYQSTVRDGLIELAGLPKLDSYELGEAISEAVNSTLFNPDDVADVLLRDHRTLQQSAMKLALTIVEKFADVGLNNTDARNEAGVKTCKELVDLYREKHGKGMRPSYLPHI